MARQGPALKAPGTERVSGASRIRVNAFERRRELNRPGGSAAPLAGLRVLVTRPEAQAHETMERLRAVGAEPVSFPAIQVADAADGGAALRAGAREIAGFDWVVLTSVNGVERLIAALAAEGIDRDALGGVRIACVGPGTAGALRRYGLETDVVPEARYVGEALVEALPLAELRGRRVLLPVAAGARPLVRQRLEQAGAEVRQVEAYRTEADGRGAAEVRARLGRGEIDVVTFGSPSAVDRFVEAVGKGLGGALVAAIGPVTAEAAEAHGLSVQVVAKEHTIPGLIETLIEHYTNTSR